MRGIILAGGLGTRLRPLTESTSKHLLPLAGRPMILYPLECLTSGGIDEILIVTSARHVEDFQRLLGSGADHGIRRLEFALQEGEGGIADALSLGEEFARGGKVTVILGDNIIGGTIRPNVERFRAQEAGARILVTPVPDPQRFGVAVLEGEPPGARVIEVEEKPEHPRSSLAVIGIYFYGPDVFPICRSIEPSARGELEITDVNRVYLERDELSCDLLEGWWADAGTIESLQRAADLVRERGANGRPPSGKAESTPPRSDVTDL